jgi:hypothetical protein
MDERADSPRAVRIVALTGGSRLGRPRGDSKRRQNADARLYRTEPACFYLKLQVSSTTVPCWPFELCRTSQVIRFARWKTWDFGV